MSVAAEFEIARRGLLEREERPPAGDKPPVAATEPALEFGIVLTALLKFPENPSTMSTLERAAARAFACGSATLILVRIPAILYLLAIYNYFLQYCLVSI